MSLLDRLRYNNLKEQSKVRGLFPAYTPQQRTSGLLIHPTTQGDDYEYSTKGHHRAIPDPLLEKPTSNIRDVANVGLMLRRYHQFEKLALNEAFPQDREKILEMTTKVMNRQYRAYFNNYMIYGQDLRHLIPNPGYLTSNLFAPLFNRAYKDVAIPIWMNGNDLNPPERIGHMFVILRHGENIEVYDSSNLPQHRYAPAFKKGLDMLLTELLHTFHGDIEFNTEAYNLLGNCDRISCVRAHHKELRMKEFNKQFVVPGLPTHTLENIDKEFMKAGIAENILLSAIKTYEPEAQHKEQSMMAEEDRLSANVREALQKKLNNRG